MVWIYGGANIYGANSLSVYDGSAFARDGVILVSVNYRLGALGFFAHPALTAAAAPGEPLGDYALMDQIAALKWVQRNIGAFGGDPGKVTVFGESAGGINILALMSIPSARGLFAQAIVESAQGGTRPSLGHCRSQGRFAGGEDRPGRRDTGATARASRRQDHRRGRPFRTDRRWPPHARRHDCRLRPWPCRRRPVNHWLHSFEASLMAAFNISPEGYVAVQSPTLVAAYADDPTTQAKAYDLFTDAVMGAPARWIAGKESGGAPSWLYYFSFRRAVYEGHLPGAPHASEIPFVFDSWDHIDPQLSRGPETPEDKAVTNVMHACWVAFAKTGAPNCPTPQPWPTYTPARDQLMEFGDTVSVKTNFRKPQLDAQEASKAALIAAP